jgi:predicted nucleic acid-binding protein
VREFVLGASFALHWCFEDGATEETDFVLTALQNQEAIAWVPGIWRYEVLNGLGKGVTRGRLGRDKALLFWREILELPIRTVDVPVDESLLALALLHNLSIYDACYLSLAQMRKLPLATSDAKLRQAVESSGFLVMQP